MLKGEIALTDNMVIDHYFYKEFDNYFFVKFRKYCNWHLWDNFNKHYMRWEWTI